MPNESQDLRSPMVGVQATVQMPLVADLPPALYANYIAVTHTDFEVTLDFAQMAMPITEDEIRELGKNPRLHAKHVARIAIPHVVLEPLINLLVQRRDIISKIAEQKAREAAEAAQGGDA